MFLVSRGSGRRNVVILVPVVAEGFRSRTSSPPNVRVVAGTGVVRTSGDLDFVSDQSVVLSKGKTERDTEVVYVEKETFLTLQ